MSSEAKPSTCKIVQVFFFAPLSGCRMLHDFLKSTVLKIADHDGDLSSLGSLGYQRKVLEKGVGGWRVGCDGCRGGG